MRIALNGFGRIGRSFVRALFADQQALKNIELVAINIGPAQLQTVAHMFTYDTLMGTYSGSVSMKDNQLTIDGHTIELLTECDPAAINWKSRNIDWVVEASGCFTKREGAQKHCDAGAQKVLITAPAKNEDVSIVPGVNDTAYDAQKHTIVSLGSCTTNAFAVMLKVLHENFVLEDVHMTTVHAYTNTQVLLDVEDSDLRRSRAAALNIIPTTTGAAKVLSKIMPELDGKVRAMAIRVPVAKVSLLDVTFSAQKKMDITSINKAFVDAATSSLSGKLGIAKEPLVSSDFSGNNYSVVIDTLATDVQGKLAKVLGWYDNEWGYSVRLKDFLLSNA